MSRHRSFLPSDFSLRDVPALLVAYLLLSAACVASGILLRVLPPFWQGILCGMGLGLAAGVWLSSPRRVDVSALPAPSSRVRQMCEDPDCRYPSQSFAQAVKVYREEMGADLAEATALVRGLCDDRDGSQRSADG